jgi:hypothetical protein
MKDGKNFGSTPAPSPTAFTHAPVRSNPVPRDPPRASRNRPLCQPRGTAPLPSASLAPPPPPASAIRPRIPAPQPSPPPRAAAVPGSPRRRRPCLCSTPATTGPTPLGAVEPIFNLCGDATLRLRFVLFSTAGEHPGLEAPFLLGTAPAAVATSASLKIRLLWCAAACLVTQLRGPVGCNIAQLAAREKPNCWALLLGSRGRRSRFCGRETGWFSEGSQQIWYLFSSFPSYNPYCFPFS